MLYILYNSGFVGPSTKSVFEIVTKNWAAPAGCGAMKEDAVWQGGSWETDEWK